jgi:uncharacterized membrane protein YeaQ/YmgE (transglycosylase-associated protein family)
VSILGWILLGFLAGLIARTVMPGEEADGALATILLGVVGALVGGFVAATFGLGDPIDAFFDASTWLAAVVGSLLLLAIWRLLRERGPYA